MGWIPRLKEAITAIAPAEFTIKHYLEASPDLVAQYNANVVILYGRVNSDWGENEMPLFEQEYQLARTCSVPLLGICAGHQLLGMAYGAEMDYISKEPKISEEGYVPVRVTGTDPILDGLESEFIVRQQHYCELKEVPPGFSLLASTDITPIQFIKDNRRPVYGVQFHPEWYNHEYPHGRVILSNFLKLA